MKIAKTDLQKSYFLKNLALMRLIDTLNREILDTFLLPSFIHSLQNSKPHIKSKQNKHTKSITKLKNHTEYFPWPIAS